MRIYQNIQDFKPVLNAIVTLGTFDGVHLGHKAIFNRMTEEAREVGGETVVITFHPHPRLVLNKDVHKLRFISDQQKKINRLKKLGIDNLVIIEFTKAFSRIPSEKFIEDFIVRFIKPYKMIVGYDHHFGKNRMGDFKNLFELANKHHFKIERIAAQDVDNIAVSSTKIRACLEKGDVVKANALLGYTYSISGKVVPGNALGRKIDFPTANLLIEDDYKLISAVGVYAVEVDIGEEYFKGMANIGYRPTLSDGGLTVEVHIFDFERDIYGQMITIYFLERIRDEIKFDNTEQLKSQLERDRNYILQILESKKAVR